MDVKFAEIKKAEAEDKEKHNKLLDVTQKIFNLKRSIEESETQSPIAEKELKGLKFECSTLKVDLQVKELQVESIKHEVKNQDKILQLEAKRLEELQDGISRKIENFIEAASNRFKESDNTESIVEDFLKNRNALEKMKETEKENFKLEGEVKGLELFRKHQENRIMRLKSLLNRLQDAKIHPDN